ncbi:hypothetical protein YTPLAS21_01090 [Candidatus Nitrosocosmicus sp.]|nr:hypothetical protein YTPLAS21_01090 [Candidatus Nitrosocosmicus sp.]
MAISDTLATTNEEEEQQQDTQQSPESDNDQVTGGDSGNSIPAVILGLYEDRSYSPNPITIERGQTVTWYNGDTISHSVTSGQGDDEDAGEEFDSKAIIPNQSYSITFEDSGEYPYYCFYHPSMVGGGDSRVNFIWIRMNNIRTLCLKSCINSKQTCRK